MRNRFVIGAVLDWGSQARTTITGDNTKTGGTKDAVVVAHSHTATSNDVTPPTGITELGRLDLQSGWYGGNYARAAVGNVPLYMHSNGAHRHTITVAEQGVSGTNQNLPPYYALAFIMRIS